MRVKYPKFFGLNVELIPEFKGYSIVSRDYPYHPATYVAKTRGGAVSQALKSGQIQADCFFDALKSCWVSRHHEWDHLIVNYQDSDDGSMLRQFADTLSENQFAKLLDDAGIFWLNDSRKYSKSDLKAGRSLFYMRSSNGRLEFQKMDETNYPSSLYSCAEIALPGGFTGYWYSLTELAKSVIMLSLSVVAKSVGLGVRLGQVDRLFNLINSAEVCMNGRIFLPHMMLGEKTCESIPQLKARIYSGEWGMYWRDSSGYTSDKDSARQWDILEAYQRVHHCGNEKAIFLELDLANN